MNLEEKIDLYLSGNMTVQDSADFKLELAADPAMQKEVELQQLAIRALQQKGELHVKSMLQKHEADRKSVFSISTILGIVALLATSLVLYYFFQQSPAVSEEVILAQYFDPYKSPTVLRGSEEDVSAWTRGAQAYADKDYRRATKEFSLITSDAVTPLYLVKFYHANSILASEKGETASAIKLLTELTQGQHDYVQQSRWYLVQAFLKDGKRNEAIEILNEIIESKQYKHKEAKELLELLDTD